MKTSIHKTVPALPPQRVASVYLALLPVAFVLGVWLGYILWGQKAAQAAKNSDAPAASATQQTVKRYDIAEDDDYVLGPADAPITIIEFSDYQCPFCTKYEVQVAQRLRQEFPDQIRFIYRDFPLYSIHPFAAPAAEAANCAGEQGAYWQYHDALFSGKYEFSQAAFAQYAAELSLDAGQFKDCLDSRKYQAEVEADYEYAANLGIRSTPTIFINGLAVVGAQPYEVFQEIVQKELAGEIP